MEGMRHAAEGLDEAADVAGSRRRCAVEGELDRCGCWLLLLQPWLEVVAVGSSAMPGEDGGRLLGMKRIRLGLGLKID